MICTLSVFGSFLLSSLCCQIFLIHIVCIVSLLYSRVANMAYPVICLMDGPYNLKCWNAKSPDGRTVWEGKGDVVLLQEVCHWGPPVRFQNSTPFPVTLCHVLVNQDVNSQIWLQCHFCCHDPCHNGFEL